MAQKDELVTRRRAVLGHSQINLTLGTYSHVVPELAQDAADRMGDVLWG